MERVLTLGVVLALAFFADPASASGATPVENTTSVYNFNVGVGKADITPTEEVTLAGSPSPKKTSSVDTPLFVKAMVVSTGDQKLAIITLDTLKYPTELVVQAQKHIEAITHIPSSNIIICASHTHFGPLYSYYEDKLITSIGKAVTIATNNMEPCKIGTAKTRVEGMSQNRRLLKNGGSWNTWLVTASERAAYPAEGPVDTELNILAVVGKDESYKAILYNYACHPVSTPGAMISADYPGHVQKHIEEHLGYQVPTLFLLGSCGDVNSRKSGAVIGDTLGKKILSSLGSIELIATPDMRVESRDKNLPGRERIEFNEQDISLKWKGQLEHYRKAFKKKKQQRKPAYRFILNGIRIGDDFAIITNPVELFCEIGIRIKIDSPFKNTMVATLTNGAAGYVPTERSFKLGGYETWYGEHSFLATRAGEVIQTESQRLLRYLENENP